MKATTQRDTGLSIAKTFDLKDVPENVLTSGFAHDAELPIPRRNDNYVFNREVLRDILNFLDNPRGDGLFLSGHYGTGKTSSIMEVAARLNYPLLSVDGGEDFMVEDMIGRTDLVNGNTVFTYGPLVQAMKNGYIFLFNEIDSVPAGRLTMLHDILEGRPLTIAATGETIYPGENFRFAATGNSCGAGDHSGLYQGVNTLNIAFMDRFRLTECDYLDSSIEVAILGKTSPGIPEPVRVKMVKLANLIRRQFVGDSGVDATLTITMSTRTLVRWAALCVDFRNADNPLEYSLRRSLTFKAEPEQRVAIEQLAKDVFGNEWGGLSL